ncbi:4-hydroxy-tetrahydrodipicolinate synthase [Dyadobacter sp. BE34]|uniref:4-hydroxy-tetrahydrodipicolinate synthase n=1 Tax=Dyadobacter fermentans TaxID=94254 RepID=A0ABU1QPY7_9BACT|nr:MULTISPECIES: dihydrodipicolinate synthase family protein [Dyadobacter]MDR6803219.1 4-hydroxy-tetrahydrodipicolinate synthase [Dyadobacter fermentans]MDR7040960.1 4-hydroxy-tetrahydrodipicolinate synthase [Dyadobacter sp. BE242]MDR7195363.1 4-hydroxy-tetrahydrodipicolinate synthase [Dyadobacter sp. BE34]MDR7214092.1 4-hydroxy-tetrahydrodipicolinate synthase [Dyadobacter sp. BE31]MDR7260770.1 4-hydroxy-tetrahydrodipicolinate synthase [Dyadobacter sp. BE32]
MNKEAWSGIFPALVTPFKSDDTVDFELFGKNLEAQVEAGITGVIVGGSLGEASTLTRAEKMELVKYAKQALPAGLPVVLGIAEQSTAEAISIAKEAESIGADGLMILPPMRYKADDDETVTWFKTIAESVSLSIMIYNNPYDYKIEVTLPMFEELAKVPNIHAIKESTRDVSNVTRLFNKFGDRFRVFCGVDTLIMEEVMLGADGVIGGLVDAFPKETVAIFNLVKAGQYKEALAIYRWYLPLLELDIHPKLVQNIKLAAAKMGIGSEYVRAPRLPLHGAEREKVLAIIDQAIATQPELPDYLNLTVDVA